MLDLTVITPTIRERGAYLDDCIATVEQQTLRPRYHLIVTDYLRAGPCAVRNEMLSSVTTEWVLFLDDDDLLDPYHLEVIAPRLDGADVVYTYYRLHGASGTPLNRPFDPERLKARNFIPITAACRTSQVIAAGAFDERDYHEDWGLWKRLLAGGARFECVPQVTWTYRFHMDFSTNRSMTDRSEERR